MNNQLEKSINEPDIQFNQSILSTDRNSRFIWVVISAILIFLVVLYALMRIFVFDFFVVSGLGMEPNFEKGDWVLLKTYDKDYSRGDIIVFKDPQFNENSFKRIVGLPGEKIKIVGNSIFVNNKGLDESCYLPVSTKTLKDTELTLKENEYFVLGDNRENSIDSRVFGAITKESIIGKYWLSLFSFENENKLINCFKEDKFNDWQIYTNEEHEFEIKYPNDFIQKEDNATSQLFSGTDGHFWIFIESNTNGIGAVGLKDDYYKNDEYGYQYQDSFPIIGQVESYQQGRYDLGVIERFYIPKNDKVYKINFEFNFTVPNQTLKEEKISLINQIISTFKFIEQNEFANWKTYQSEKYKFEIQYPKEWIVEEKNDYISFSHDISTEEQIHGELGLSLMINVEQTEFSYIQQWFDNKFLKRSEDWRPKTFPFSIGNIQGIKFSDPVSMSGCDETVALINNSTVYILSRHGSTCDYNSEIFDQIYTSFKFQKTYQNEEFGFEFKYNPNWSIASVNTGSGYDALQPFILLWTGATSDVSCQDIGCPPKSGDRDELTKGYTLEGAPQLNPWFKILRVRGNKWVSIQVTDVRKNCSSETICQQYLSGALLEQKLKVDDSDYQTYNDFIELLSTFKFTK